MRVRARNTVLAATFAIVLAACGGSPGSEPEATATSEVPMEASPSAAASAAPTERLEEVVTKAGGTIHVACFGEGEPAIVIEAGSDSAGTEQYSPAFLDPLAERTTVCTYDRPGTGGSRDLPDHRRTLDDVCEVQAQVIEALDLPDPYVLAGQSAGGNMVIGCAQRHPERLAGLVVIEGYHDDPKEMRKFQKEEGWTWQENPEHLDYIDITDELDAMDMPIGDFPVLVVSATDADSGGAKNQRYWLDLSPESRQVIIEGGHDIHDENPLTVAEEITALLDG